MESSELPSILYSYVFWALQRNICNTNLQLSPSYILCWCSFCRWKTFITVACICLQASWPQLSRTLHLLSAEAMVMPWSATAFNAKIEIPSSQPMNDLVTRIHAYPQACKVSNENFERDFNCSTRATRPSHLIHLGYITKLTIWNWALLGRQPVM
jgi:hypothetical protein